MIEIMWVEREKENEGADDDLICDRRKDGIVRKKKGKRI